MDQPRKSQKEREEELKQYNKERWEKALALHKKKVELEQALKTQQRS